MATKTATKEYYTKFQVLFDEFGIKSSGSTAENELLEIMDIESKTVPCVICGREQSFDNLIFDDGEPICRYGCLD